MPRWARRRPQTPEQMLTLAKAITSILGGQIDTGRTAPGGEPR